MGFFSFGRIVGAFFNQLFRWLFWNKTGQKILFVIVIAFILVAFVKLGEVAAAEPDNFSSWDEIAYDDNPYLGFGDNATIESTTTHYMYVYELNPYNYYSITTNNFGSNRRLRVAFSDSYSIGTQVTYQVDKLLVPGESYELNFSGSGNKKYLLIWIAGGTPHVYYNAYPYEVTPVWSWLSMYGTQLRYVYDPNDFRYNQNSWFFPVKEGYSYRLLSEGNTFTNDYQLGFITSLDPIFSFLSTPTYQTGVPNQYNPNIEIGNFYIHGSDFVAPSDGYIVVAGYKPDSSTSTLAYTNFSLFSSDNGVSVTNYNSSVNQNINQSTSAINEVNSSLTDSSISEDDSDYVLPESGVTDIAESGFANIFDKLRTAFTTESSGQGLVVQVPFTDKSFTISRSTVFGSADLGIVGTLINSFWYFIVSLWIVKDIAHKMNMIKSGNIELAQTSNIKEDLL